jgi:hypothetical protein
LGVSGDFVGGRSTPCWCPPQAERFASLVGADLDRLVLNVTGWNKLVLLDSHRVFLFPRSSTGVEWFERELAAYRALAGARLSVVPRLRRSSSLAAPGSRPRHEHRSGRRGRRAPGPA